jgi:hypothetical protein
MFLACRLRASLAHARLEATSATLIQKRIRGFLTRRKLDLSALITKMKVEKERKKRELELMAMSRPAIGGVRIIEDTKRRQTVVNSHTH